MFHNTKRKFVVVESCFEAIFCHGHVFTCSSGCFCACCFVDDVICETLFFHQKVKGPCFCSYLFPLLVISHLFNIFLLWFLIVLAILVVQL